MAVPTKALIELSFLLINFFILACNDWLTLALTLTLDTALAVGDFAFVILTFAVLAYLLFIDRSLINNKNNYIKIIP